MRDDWTLTAPMAELRERLGRICSGWDCYNDEDQHVDDEDDEDVGPVVLAQLGTFGGIGVRAVVALERAGWSWRLYDPGAGTEPRGLAPSMDEAIRSAEDAAIEAGYRVPWREVARG